MKGFIIHKSGLIVFLLLVLNCSQPEGDIPGRSGKEEIPAEQDHRILFTQKHAIQILGEPALLQDSSTQFIGGVNAFSCSYGAVAMDSVSGKKGAVYVMLQQFSKSSDATKTYSKILKDNEDHEGVEILKNIGDEAYFHSDHQNFYFILIRNGEKVFRMKVNKITSHTSLEDFHAVAKEITAVM